MVEKKLKNGGRLTNLPFASYDYSKVRFHCVNKYAQLLQWVFTISGAAGTTLSNHIEEPK